VLCSSRSTSKGGTSESWDLSTSTFLCALPLWIFKPFSDLEDFPHWSHLNASEGGPAGGGPAGGVAGGTSSLGAGVGEGWNLRRWEEVGLRRYGGWLRRGWVVKVVGLG